jgi:hypothetical protein
LEHNLAIDPSKYVGFPGEGFPTYQAIVTVGYRQGNRLINTTPVEVLLITRSMTA